MKKIILYVLALVPIASFSHNISSNINIIKLDEMTFPGGIKLTEEVKNQINAHVKEMKKKGYVEKNAPYASYLASMKYFNVANEKYTRLGADELKNTSSEVKTIFTFKPALPNAIAYMGIGMETKQGWSGIKEFFNDKETGICSLSILKSYPEKGSIQLNEETVTYEVNDKPTSIYIYGNKNDGFIYSVEWYDIDYVRNLECLSYKLNDKIKYKMIEHAKLIDRE